MNPRAAVLRAVNQPLDICEIEPLPLNYGQVAVKVIASGICGSQLQEVRGEKGTHLPRLLGHEGVAIVKEIGVGVKNVKVGDKTVLHWRKGAGIESESPFVALDGKAITCGQVTTFGTDMVVSENRVTAVPVDTPSDLASLLGCGLSTAFGTLEREARLLAGESILIVGCGGLGLNLIRVAKMLHATPIVAVDIHMAKQQSAQGAGADYFSFNGYGLREHFGKFDVIVETSGNAGAIEYTIPLLASGGRYVLVGQPKPDEIVPMKNARHLFDGEQGKTIKATQGGGFQPSRDIPRYIKLFKAGCLTLSGIVSHRIEFKDINRGLDLVRAGEAGRVLVEMV